MIFKQLAAECPSHAILQRTQVQSVSRFAAAAGAQDRLSVCVIVPAFQNRC